MSQSTILTKTSFKDERNQLDSSTEQNFYLWFSINNSSRQQKKFDFYLKNV